MKEQCYAFFECKEATCVKHKIPDEPCWDLEGTPCKCHNAEAKLIRKKCASKEEVCKKCAYYKKYGKAYH